MISQTEKLEKDKAALTSKADKYLAEATSAQAAAREHGKAAKDIIWEKNKTINVVRSLANSVASVGAGAVGGIAGALGQKDIAQKANEFSEACKINANKTAAVALRDEKTVHAANVQISNDLYQDNVHFADTEIKTADEEQAKAQTPDNVLSADLDQNNSEFKDSLKDEEAKLHENQEIPEPDADQYPTSDNPSTTSFSVLATKQTADAGTPYPIQHEAAKYENDDEPDRDNSAKDQSKLKM